MMREMHAGKPPGTSTGHDGAKAPHKLPIRALIAASVGNAVEWYDWTIYATFSIYFATQIFSAENKSLAFIQCVGLPRRACMLNGLPFPHSLTGNGLVAGS